MKGSSALSQRCLMMLFLRSVWLKPELCPRCQITKMSATLMMRWSDFQILTMLHCKSKESTLPLVLDWRLVRKKPPKIWVRAFSSLHFYRHSARLPAKAITTTSTSLLITMTRCCHRQTRWTSSAKPSGRSGMVHAKVWLTLSWTWSGVLIQGSQLGPRMMPWC